MNIPGNKLMAEATFIEPPDDSRESIADFRRPADGVAPWARDLGGKPLWDRVGGKRGSNLREIYEERAGIIQFCGNETREVAERMAYQQLLDRWAKFSARRK